MKYIVKYEHLGPAGDINRELTIEAESEEAAATIIKDKHRGAYSSARIISVEPTGGDDE